MKSWIECRWRGVLSSVVIGAAALFVSNTYGGPTVLYALLLGMAFHFISEDNRAVAGIELCAKNFLRIGDLENQMLFDVPRVLWPALRLPSAEPALLLLLPLSLTRRPCVNRLFWPSLLR